MLSPQIRWRRPPDGADGSRIAFASRRDGIDYEIYVINADGSGPIRLTNIEPDNYAPAWSPDGSKLAYTRYSDATSEIYVMNADGSGQTNLTNHPAYDSGASWKPVSAFAFGGFLAPVDNAPTVNVAKAGRGIPVKFSLGGDHGLDIFLAGYPRFVGEPCDASVPQDPIEVVSDSRGGLSYDPATRQYTYVWKVPTTLAGQCGRLELGLRDTSG